MGDHISHQQGNSGRFLGALAPSTPPSPPARQSRQIASIGHQHPGSVPRADMGPVALGTSESPVADPGLSVN